MGAVISQTGAHAELAADYLKGLQLWREHINESGGLLERRVELRVLDDNSRAVRARELYAELLRDKVDLLIGPYGSAATLLAAAEAERARRVMVNGADPSAAVHSRPGRYVFQTAMPYSAYGLGVLQVAATTDLRRLFIVARDDAASREMAEATRNAAANGFVPGELELYRPGTLDFAAQVAKARAANADAWIAFGDVRDAAEMVKTFKRLDYAPQLFFASGASHPRFIALLGQDAEFSLGVVDFDARIGDAARAFAKSFTSRWTVPPQLAAAEGYTAGTVLAAAVRSTGSLDQERLRAALAELEL
ncbi:MAG TPA: ABC transporter substrate-binding protein, partial [Burkholderiales bacterium]|nr:ABC transporter substrate-binding protein [Burkholderiales bacterium]